MYCSVDEAPSYFDAVERPTQHIHVRIQNSSAHAGLYDSAASVYKKRRPLFIGQRRRRLATAGARRVMTQCVKASEP